MKHLCSRHGTSVVLNAGHHLRAKNNQPIFGIFTQPMPKEWYYHPQLRKSNGDYYTQYFESSHAEFLQAAGARVVPIDYQLSRIELKAKLE